MADSSDSVPKLFQPVQVGDVTLGHRVVLAPLTRCRANKAHIHTDLAVTYYAQRASVPGTFLISEATFITAKAGIFGNVPGIWSEAQIAAWKKVGDLLCVPCTQACFALILTRITLCQVTDAVHEKGSYIYCQLWALGRAAAADVLKKEGFDVVSSSAVPISEKNPTPRELREEEIHAFIKAYADAARNAVEVAGFDGVPVLDLEIDVPTTDSELLRLVSEAVLL